MDVRCTGCATEYEFDDALISERGTSVRCTQCGHQFRVFPPDTRLVGPDEWVILTSLGRRVVYRSLRELQQGIGRGEISREDLLARGTAPPRPLGSIAELDPLFAVKAIPEHKPSTLTGVAPPPAASGKAEANPLREQHDTWSGVAPPANPPEKQDARARPAAPMRVPAQSPTFAAAASPKTIETTGSEVAQGDGPSAVERLGTRPQASESAVGHPTDRRAARSLGRVHTQLGIGYVPPSTPVISESVAAPLSAESNAAPMEEAPSEAPARDAPASPIDEAQPVPEPEREGPASLEIVASAPSHALNEPVTTRAIPIRTELESESPDSGVSRDASPSGAKDDAAESTRARPALQVADTSHPGEDAKRDASASRDAGEVDARVGRPDALTSPPSRPRRAIVEAKREPRRSGLSPLVWVGLIVLPVGAYFGMRLVADEAPAPAPSALSAAVQVASPKTTTSAPPAGSLPAGSVTTESALTEASDAKATSIEGALAVGDSGTARSLLREVSEPERQTMPYRGLAVLAQAMEVDMLWWELRLANKAETARLASISRALTPRLAYLGQNLEACRKDEACKAATLPAYWAFHRMSGSPEQAAPPKQGNVDANGLYQLAMLEWVKANKPDAKTQSRLAKARLPGVEQGPWVTALIVALIDSGRLDEAKAELAALAKAAKAHPHLEQLGSYLRQVAVPEETGASDAADADEREPDFRVRLRKAVACLGRNELTKAQRLFRSVLDQRPNDTEALAGLADVYRRRGELAQAKKEYDRVLAMNPNYLPAMAGAADVRWQSGDRAGAVALYRTIVERVGQSPGYGQSAANRIAEFEGGGSVRAEPSGSPKRGEPAP